MSLTKIVSTVAAFSLVASGAYASDSPRVANSARGIQSPQAGEWVTAGGVSSDAPKPSCGKKPRDGEYIAKFKKEKDGTYSACVWSYVGPRESYWSTLQRCMLSTQNYQYCVSLGSGANSYGYSSYNGREETNHYSCRDNHDRNCYLTPAPADPREYRR